MAAEAKFLFNWFCRFVNKDGVEEWESGTVWEKSEYDAHENIRETFAKIAQVIQEIQVYSVADEQHGANADNVDLSGGKSSKPKVKNKKKQKKQPKKVFVDLATMSAFVPALIPFIPEKAAFQDPEFYKVFPKA